jgi:hypothetical protein
MEIKKGKVLKDREWSPSTQKKLASMLGVSVVTVLAACTAGDPIATGGDIEEADSSSSEQMTCGEMPCDGDIGPESSSSQTNFSSSIDPVGGISSSSDAPRPVSSSYEIDTLEVTSGEVIPPEIVGPESGSNIDTGHLESSSSIAEPSSSSYQRIESSSTTSGLPLSSSEAIPGDPIEIDDPKD